MRLKLKNAHLSEAAKFLMKTKKIAGIVDEQTRRRHPRSSPQRVDEVEFRNSYRLLAIK